MRNCIKILCSLVVLTGFVFAALSCKTQQSAYTESFEKARGSKGGNSGSGKDDSYLIPEQYETVPALQAEKPVLPESI